MKITRVITQDDISGQRTKSDPKISFKMMLFVILSDKNNG